MVISHLSLRLPTQSHANETRQTTDDQSSLTELSVPFDARVGRAEAMGDHRPREMAVLDRTRLTGSLRLFFFGCKSLKSGRVKQGEASGRCPTRRSGSAVCGEYDPIDSGT
jgi:hypothetical protein